MDNLQPTVHATIKIMTGGDGMKQKNPLKEEIGVRLNTLLSYPIDVDGLGGMTSCLTSFMVEHDLPSDHNSESGPEAT